MDYKEEYEAMVQRAREFHEAGNALTKKQMEIVCPELAESEDERIRKTLIEELSACETVGELKFRLPQPTRDEVLAWLEKQKEQKPTEVKDPFSNANFVRGYESGYADARREQKPAEWSEEDEKMVKEALYCVGYTFGNTHPLVAWLKSLRPSWKPSEEQMEALEYVIRDYREDSCNATANYLQEILDHLKNM